MGRTLTRRIEADINEPLPELAGGAAFRLNLVATEGGVAGRPYAQNRHYGLAPSLTFGMNSAIAGDDQLLPPVRRTTRRTMGCRGSSTSCRRPNRHAYFGFPDANYLRADVDVLTGKAGP